MSRYIFIKVKVEAEAKEDRIERLKDDEFLIKTRALKRNGEANKRVVEILAEYLRIPSSNILLVKGHTSPSKIFKVYR